MKGYFTSHINSKQGSPQRCLLFILNFLLQCIGKLGGLCFQHLADISAHTICDSRRAFYSTWKGQRPADQDNSDSRNSTSAPSSHRPTPSNGMTHPTPCLVRNTSSTCAHPALQFGAKYSEAFVKFRTKCPVNPYWA